MLKDVFDHFFNEKRLSLQLSLYLLVYIIYRWENFKNLIFHRVDLLVVFFEESKSDRI